MSNALDAILDDALQVLDFEDTTKAAISPVAQTSTSEGEKETNKTPPPQSAPIVPPSPQLPSTSDSSEQDAWADEMLKKLGSEDPEVMRLMEEFTKALQSPGTEGVPPGAASSSDSVPLPNLPDMDWNNPEMKSKLEHIQKMIQEVESGNESEDMLDKILEATGLSKMMEQMLSKDVLLEPFQEMDKQYTSWLAQNTQISDQDAERYRKQHALVKRIVSIYETQGDEASATVGALIGEMQELGDPPQGIIQELVPGLSFDENGKPIMNDEAKPNMWR